MTKTLLTYALAALALATNGFGAAITNITVTALFKNSVDTLGGSPTITPGAPAALTTVSWGIPPGALGQSNYTFQTQNTAGPIAINPPSVTPYFTLGTFTHNNFVIDEPYLVSVDLDVILQFSVNGNPAGPFTLTYGIQHTETPNVVETGSLCPFATVIGQECTDRVIINSVAPQLISVDGNNYVLELSFLLGGNPVNTFLTAEGAANTAEIVARFMAADSQVPEPGTLVGVSMGLIGLALVRRRSSKRG